MEIQRHLILHVGHETFLMAVTDLTRAQVRDIEALAEAAFDDHGDELEDMSVYQVSQWFQDKVKTMYNIELHNLSIDYEFSVRI